MVAHGQRDLATERASSSASWAPDSGGSDDQDRAGGQLIRVAIVNGGQLVNVRG